MIKLDIINITDMQPLQYNITYNDVLGLLGDQLTSAMLGVSVLFLFMCVVITRTSFHWTVKSWSEIFQDGIQLNQDLGIRLIVSMGWICLPISLGFSLMLASYKLGIVI